MQSTDVVNDIVSVGKNMGLEVNSVDVEDLVEEHSTELSTDKIKLHQKE